MNRKDIFEQVYGKIISQGGLTQYYAAYADNGKQINWDQNLMDLQMNCTMAQGRLANRFRIYKINKLTHPPEFTLIETYQYDKENDRWMVTPNSEKVEEEQEEISGDEYQPELKKERRGKYVAMFSFEGYDKGTEIHAPDFITCKKYAYQYAQQSDETEIKIFDPSGNLYYDALYKKAGFNNGRHFKVIKGN